MNKSSLSPEQQKELDQQLTTAINQYGMASVTNALANSLDRKAEKLLIPEYREVASTLRDVRNAVLEGDYQSQSQESN